MKQYRRLGVSFSSGPFALYDGRELRKSHLPRFLYLLIQGRPHLPGQPHLQLVARAALTSLSDLEVEHENLKGHLYLIKYPLTDESGSLTLHSHDQTRNTAWRRRRCRAPGPTIKYLRILWARA